MESRSDKKRGEQNLPFLNGEYLLSYFSYRTESTEFNIRLQHHGESGMCYRRPSIEKIHDNLIQTCLWNSDTYASFSTATPLQYTDVHKAFYYYLGYLKDDTNRIDYCADYDSDGTLTYSDLVRMTYAFLGYVKPNISFTSNEYVPLPYCELKHDNLIGEDDNWLYDSNYFTVADGVVTGEGSPNQNTFFIYTNGNISNFRLDIQVRVTGIMNSGVQYRSALYDNYKVCGYQYEVENNEVPSSWGTGGMYDECGELGGRDLMGMLGKETSWGSTAAITEEKRLPFYGDHALDALDAPPWKNVTIKAFRNQHYHYLNGRLVVKVLDLHPQGRTTGHIALQLHSGSAQKVEFRNARLFECNLH